MAGSIALSLTQRYDKNSHEPLAGGLLYFYAAGTTTPQSAYQDISLTIPWPNPMTLDSGGNVNQLFFADGYIKFRLANAAGVTQIEADFVLVLGPTSGGGAAPSVDPTTIIQTGWLQPIYGTGNITGFVRCNGRTIGNAASTATERANADTVALFSFLYGQDANLVVSGGRGANAAVDYAANKTIALPDWRGRALAFLDDMGNSAAGRLSGSMSPNGTTLGAAGGAESVTIGQANLPNVSFTVSGSVSAVPKVGGVGSPLAVGFGAGSATFPAGAGPALYGTSAFNTLTIDASMSGSAASGGSGTALNKVMPAMLATIYVKL